MLKNLILKNLTPGRAAWVILGVAAATILGDFMDDILAAMEAGSSTMPAQPDALSGPILQITLTIDPLADRTYLGDAVRVRQVLINLVSNAVKFTAAGEVGLALQTGDDGRVRFVVSDTGVGFEPAFKARFIEQQFAEPMDSSPEEFRDAMRAETQTWGRVIREQNLVIGAQ